MGVRSEEESLWMLEASVLLITSSSVWMKECMGVSGFGGRDTCMKRSSPLASESKHSTKATLSWSRLVSAEEQSG